MKPQKLFLSCKILTLLCCLTGALSIALGAFGAHLLQEYLENTNKLSTWNTAVFYHLTHSIMAFVAVEKKRPTTSLFFLLGIFFFSTSLYLLCLFPCQTWLGPITPLGGILFIAAWIKLGIESFVQTASK